MISSIKILLCLFILTLPVLNLDASPASPAKSPSGSWEASADFLAWYASEEVASIWADVVTIGNNTSSWGAPGFNFKWDCGFRIGLGRHFANDSWDSAIYWTWFFTDARHSLFSSAEVTIGPEFYAAFLNGDARDETPRKMSAKWSLFFNMFDWELGSSHWVSKAVFLRPFIGIKGGWINQLIQAKYYDLIVDEVATGNWGKEHLKNNFWGIGPLGGINSKWKVCDCGSYFFNLFGDFSMAGMWGTWICSDVYKNTLSETSSVNTKNSNLGTLMFKGFMGMGWDASKGKVHFSAKIGYEMQLWLNQLRIATFQLQRLHSDITLQGLTFHCQFDF